MFLLAFNAFLLGLLSSVQEIIRELPIFLRERMVGVGAVPYVLSKTTFQAPAMAIGVVAMVAVLRVTGRLPSGGVSVYGPLIVSLILVGLAGLTLSLLTSAFVSSSQQATDLLSLWITPRFSSRVACSSSRQWR